MEYIGQLNREENGTYDMVTFYSDGVDMEVSIFVSRSSDMEILDSCRITTKPYFRFDIVLNLLLRGFGEFPS